MVQYEKYKYYIENKKNGRQKNEKKNTSMGEREDELLSIQTLSSHLQHDRKKKKPSRASRKAILFRPSLSRPWPIHTSFWSIQISFLWWKKETFYRYFQRKIMSVPASILALSRYINFNYHHCCLVNFPHVMMWFLV